MDTEATIKNLIGTLADLMNKAHGHPYTAGYLESFCTTIAQRLSAEEQVKLVEDLAERVANRAKELRK